jgi:hypothetical protein
MLINRNNFEPYLTYKLPQTIHPSNFIPIPMTKMLKNKRYELQAIFLMSKINDRNLVIQIKVFNIITSRMCIFATRDNEKKSMNA